MNMFFKEPKNTKEIYWTQHVKEKMRYYGIGEGRVRRILKSPQRREEGVALETIALMQSAGFKKKTEIWLMYQEKRSKKIIISAWRYPGVSPIGKSIPIPEDIIEELMKDKSFKILTKKE